MANTSAISQHVAHTTDQLSSCLTRARKKKPISERKILENFQENFFEVVFAVLIRPIRGWLDAKNQVSIYESFR